MHTYIHTFVRSFSLNDWKLMEERLCSLIALVCCSVPFEVLLHGTDLCTGHRVAVNMLELVVQPVCLCVCVCACHTCITL
jgi:hypothetical protein